MKKIIAILVVCVCSCQQPKNNSNIDIISGTDTVNISNGNIDLAKSQTGKQSITIQKPMVMGATYTTNVSTPTFNATINNLQSQITACKSKAFLQDSLITALQKQVNVNQNQMYLYALEFYTRTDELSILVQMKDTVQFIGNVKIDSISPHYKIITLP